ncbi:MAG: hypothetical protein RBU28_04565, partial [Bacteroidales bacterium]|nr:hypothetical protein [Bacteroidales bacterium]
YAEVLQDESQAIFGYTPDYYNFDEMVYGIAAYFSVTDGMYTILDSEGNPLDPWLVDIIEEGKGSIPALLKAPKVK